VGEPGPKELIEEKSYQGEPVSDSIVNEGTPESTEELRLKEPVTENLKKPDKQLRYKAPPGGMKERSKKLRGKLNLKVPKTHMTSEMKSRIMIIGSDYDW
jgi:hypothetical protein